MHSFYKFISEIGNFLHLYEHYKSFIGFALSVSGQSLCIPNLGYLLWILQSMKGIGIGNAFPPFLIIKEFIIGIMSLKQNKYVQY